MLPSSILTSLQMENKTSNLIIKEENLPLEPFSCETSVLEDYCCPICSLEYNTVGHLKKHVKEAHFKKETHLLNFTCQKCLFNTHSSLHALKHLLGGCRTENKIKTGLKPEKILKCDLCSFESVYRSSISRHRISRHNSHHRFECDQCTYKTNTKSHFDSHYLAKHTDGNHKRWLQCKKCSYKTLHRSTLSTHFLTKHTDDKKLQCDKCPYKTNYKTHFKSHILAKHTADADKNWIQCDQCAFKTIHKSYFKSHCLAKHDKDKKPFKCDECSFKTPWRWSFVRHLGTHVETNRS